MLIESIRSIAKEVNTDPALIYAIIKVESNGIFKYTDNTIPLLYERQWVYRYAKKELGYKQTKELSEIYPKFIYPKRGDYSKPKTFKQTNNMYQYFKLTNAINLLPLDMEFIYKSISMGAFQIMGFNHKLCGYNSAEDMFMKYHKEPEKEQIKGFIRFIQSYRNGKALKLLKALDFAGFARLYNGRNYKENRYDYKLNIAYNHYKDNMI